MQVEKIFNPVPERFGLRGDDILWQKLSELDFEGDILTAIKMEIEKITGIKLDSKEIKVYVPKLERGGMSSGYVSLEWWNEIGLPLLEERIRELLYIEQNIIKTIPHI